MEYRTLGSTNIEISSIAFGAWAIGGWMWGGTDLKEAQAAITRALDLGVTTFDTAPVYGFGLSESIIGETLAAHRPRVQLCTKYGLRWDTTKGQFYFDSKDANGKDLKIHKYASKESIVAECEASLRRLKTDYIDLYQIHWADPTTPVSESMEAVEKLVKDGKVRAAGVCNYSAELVDEALKTSLLASNQIPYSMVHRPCEEDVIPQAIEKNISILAYSPLQRGLLTGKLSRDHAFKKGDHRSGNLYFTPENIEQTNQFLQNIKPVADAHNATLPQVVIQWTIRQPGITCALVGARDFKQAEQNALASEINLSNSDMETIDRELQKLSLSV